MKGLYLILALALVLGVTRDGAPTPPTAAASVSYDIWGRALVRVNVRAGEKLILVYDPGSAMTILSPATVERLGVDTQRAGVMAAGPLDDIPVRTGWLGAARVGSCWIGTMRFYVMPLSPSVTDSAEGLLGVQTLRRLPAATFDAARETLVFDGC